MLVVGLFGFLCFPAAKQEAKKQFPNPRAGEEGRW